MKKGPVTVISLSDTHVSLSHTKLQKGTVAICYLDILEKDGLSSEESAHFISQSFSKQKIVPEQIITVLPRRLVMIKSITLPTVKDDELERMLDLQIGHQVPYAKEDIIYDFTVVEKNASGYTRILVIIVQKETIQSFIEILNKANLNCHYYIPSSWGVWAWYKIHEPDTSEASQPVILLDIKKYHCEIVFSTVEKVLFSRNINYGGQDLIVNDAVDEKILKAFLKELSLTIEAYKNGNIGPAAHQAIILTTSEKLSFLSSKIEDTLKIPGKTANPFDSIPVTKDCQLSQLKGKVTPSLTPVLGLSFLDDELPVNLIPKMVLDSKRLKVKRKVLVQMAVVLTMTCILAVSALWSQHFQRDRYLKNVESQIQQIEKKALKAESKIDSLRFLKERVQNKVFVVDIIQNLFELTPEDISFSLLDMNGKGDLIIQGATETGGSINIFQSQLVSSPLFKEVNLQYATKRRRFRTEYTDFKIICKLAQAKEFE